MKWKTSREKTPSSWQIENKTSFVEVSRALLGEKKPKRDCNKYRQDQLKGEKEALGTQEWCLSF